MLSKGKRLNLKTDFKWVAAGSPRGEAGKKTETRFAKLFIKTGDNTFPRIGIAVSSKSFKKANERNRARRLVSSVFEALYSSLPSSINIVVLPKSGVLEVKSSEVLQDLEAALKRAEII